jgi:hypothetical protein
MVAVLPFSPKKRKSRRRPCGHVENAKRYPTIVEFVNFAMLANSQNPHEGMSTGLLKEFLLL